MPFCLLHPQPRALCYPVPPHILRNLARDIRNPSDPSRTVPDFSSGWASGRVWGRRAHGPCGPRSAPIPERPGGYLGGTTRSIKNFRRAGPKVQVGPETTGGRGVKFRETTRWVGGRDLGAGCSVAVQGLRLRLRRTGLFLNSVLYLLFALCAPVLLT